MGLIGQLDSRFKVRGLVEDAILTAPSPLFRPVFGAGCDERVLAQAASEIEATAAHIPGVIVPRPILDELSAALDNAFGGGRDDLTVTVNERTGIGHIADPLRLHKAIVDLACDDRLLAIVERYLRRRLFLADVDLRRVPPMTMDELDRRAGTQSVGYTSSHWHRDIRGRQVKVMIYLTDVGDSDNNFSYIPKTHRRHHMRPRHVEESRISDDAVAGGGVTPVECYGDAGTAMVFDTNCIHRLRRRPGARIRDSVTFYYTPGQELRALPIEPQWIEDQTPAARDLFRGSRPETAH